MDKNLKKDCLLCSNLDHQVKAIINQVQIKLHQVHKNSDITQETDFQMTKNSQGFYRLIRIIFSNKLKHSKPSLSCRHQDIKRRFMKNIKCNLNVLNTLCDGLSSILGKFNFHVDVLIQQFKGFQRYLKAEAGQNQTQSPVIKQQNLQVVQRTSEISQSKDKLNNYKKEINQEKQSKRVIFEQLGLISSSLNAVVANSNTVSEHPLQEKAKELNLINPSANGTMIPMPNIFYPGMNMNMNMMWFYPHDQGNM